MCRLFNRVNPHVLLCQAPHPVFRLLLRFFNFHVIHQDAVALLGMFVLYPNTYTSIHAQASVLIQKNVSSVQCVVCGVFHVPHELQCSRGRISQFPTHPSHSFTDLRRRLLELFRGRIQSLAIHVSQGEK